MAFFNNPSYPPEDDDDAFRLLLLLLLLLLLVVVVFAFEPSESASADSSRLAVKTFFQVRAVRAPRKGGDAASKNCGKTKTE